MKLLLTFLGFFTFLNAAAASQISLAPFKDELFAYPKVLEQSKDGTFFRVEYNRDRDLVARDKVLRWKVHDKYVDRGVRWSRKVRSYRSANGSFKL